MEWRGGSVFTWIQYILLQSECEKTDEEKEIKNRESAWLWGLSGRQAGREVEEDGVQMAGSTGCFEDRKT